jgi:hypothetical protein
MVLATSSAYTFLQQLLFSALEGVGIVQYLPSITGGLVTEQWLRAYRRSHGLQGDPVSGGVLLTMVVLQAIKESGVNEVRSHCSSRYSVVGTV